MTSLNQILNRLSKIDVDDIIQRSFDDNSEEYANITIDQQLSGQRNDGTFLPDYSFVSITRYGKEPGPWTLHDTGAYHEGMYAKLDGDKIIVGSTDEKESLIEYMAGGDNIAGAQPENKKEFALGVFSESLMKYFKDGLRNM